MSHELDGFDIHPRPPRSVVGSAAALFAASVMLAASALLLGTAAGLFVRAFRWTSSW